MTAKAVSWGLWSHFPGPEVIETLASSDVDWCCIDLQHGFASMRDLLGMVHTVERHGRIPVVRVSRLDPAEIGAALDRGVQAVIVPMINDATDAVAAVAACTYGPNGVRSFGPTRLKVLGPQASAAAPSARCLPMIETKGAVEALHDIAATPGIHGLFVGPADLALALGDGTAAYEQAIAEVPRICEAHGIEAGVFGADDPIAWRSRGYTMIAAESDSSMLLRASRALARSLHHR